MRVLVILLCLEGATALLATSSSSCSLVPAAALRSRAPGPALLATSPSSCSLVPAAALRLRAPGPALLATSHSSCSLLPAAAVRSRAPGPSATAGGTSPATFLKNTGARIGCSSIAAALTWSLVAQGVGAVTASSAVGLAAGITLPTPLATAAFCGSFCGMSSLTVTPRALDAAALGAAAAALLAALDASNTRLLKGYGGRLGVVAALAATASITTTPPLRALLYQPSMLRAAAAPSALFSTVGATIAGSAAMRLWSRRLAVLLLLGSSASSLWPSAQAARASPAAEAEDVGDAVAAVEARKAIAARLSNPVASASLVGLSAGAILGTPRSAIAAAVRLYGALIPSPAVALPLPLPLPLPLVLT